MPKLYTMPTALPANAPSGLTPPLAEHTLSLTGGTVTPAFGTAPAQVVRILNAWPMQMQFFGDLGVGKTTLSRAILRSLGRTGHVRNLTYMSVEPYDVTRTMGTQRVYRLDLYRSANPGEWTDAGFRDCFAESALCLVEWPEKVQALLDTSDLRIALSADVVHETYEDSVEHASRAARLSARTQTDFQLLQSLRHLFPC